MGEAWCLRVQGTRGTEGQPVGLASPEPGGWSTGCGQSGGRGAPGLVGSGRGPESHRERAGLRLRAAALSAEGSVALGF